MGCTNFHILMVFISIYFFQNIIWDCIYFQWIKGDCFKGLWFQYDAQHIFPKDFLGKFLENFLRNSTSKQLLGSNLFRIIRLIPYCFFLRGTGQLKFLKSSGSNNISLKNRKTLKIYIFLSFENSIEFNEIVWQTKFRHAHSFKVFQ